MMIKRNELFYCALLSLTLTMFRGCAVGGTESPKRLVRISAVADVVAEDGTKAGASYIENSSPVVIPAGSSFGLSAWTGAGTAGWPDFMDNQQVFNEGGSAQGSFVYSPVKYWPEDGGLVTFTAWWPYSGDGLTPSLQSDPPSLGFTCQASPSSQVDLLVSKAFSTPAPSDGTVRIVFRHALSRIRVEVTVDDAFAAGGMSAAVTSVSLMGVKGSGQWDALTGEWTADPLSGTGYACGLGGTPGDVLLLIPQSLEGVFFRVHYTVHMLGDGGAVVSSRNLSSDVPLGGGSWLQAHSYVYRLALKESHVSVTCSVAPWTLEESSYDYSSEVTVAADGRLQWEPGTYASSNNISFQVVTAFRRDLVGNFTIQTPEGGVWYAVLETLSGDPGAFVFVDGDGGTSSSVRGMVGEHSVIRIRAVEDYPAQTNSARLSFVVRAAGRNIPVTGLVDDFGHNWTVFQNANN